MTASGVAKFVNWVWDNRQASGGYLNYCIRWQNATKLTQTYRAKMKAMFARQINAWKDYSSTNDAHFDISLRGITGFGYAGAGGDRSIVRKMGMWNGDYGEGRLVSAQGIGLKVFSNIDGLL